MNSTHRRQLEISTPTDTTIELSRTFDAPRRMVWQAMFTPDKMRRWMLPPPGFSISKCECDPRVGGVVDVAWKNDEADPAMTLRGVFTEVVPHERAIHSEIMALGSGQIFGSLVERHEFSERDGVTEMRITQTYVSQEARDAALHSGMDEGMEACYEQLDALLV